MRYRIGRTVRLVIALACLVLMIPFLMSKLDSGSARTLSADNDFDYSDVGRRARAPIYYLPLACLAQA